MVLSHCQMLQFLRASALAAFWAFRVMPWPEALGYVLGGVSGLISGWAGPKVSAEKIGQRRETCRRCPIYDRRLGTCGRPGLTDAYGHELGCWCHIETVAPFEDKTCWAIENGYAFAPEQW